MKRYGVISRDRQLNKIILMMRLVYGAQSVLVAMVALVMAFRYLINGEVPTINSVITLLVVITVMILFNGYYIFRDASVFRRLDQQMAVQGEAYRNIEALNLKLRAQRHDFLNHLQVLYSLMELEAYEETQDYLSELYGDVGKVSANIKTKCVAMNALLQAKSIEAQRKGVAYKTNINTPLDALNLPDWELCRVVGNMIDNGFRATLDSGLAPQVTIDLKETITTYEISVRNTSKPVTEAMIERFFAPGFTTKADRESHGLGLHISKEIMHHYGNTITMGYEADEVTVALTMHKSPKAFKTSG